ncbi:MAG: hypothetical protein LBL90_00440 [Prevotellaceae bacterium]|jgi:hypothetical protein|nr:hypothetical protein [Prevotellaceae bacterium]
MIINFDTTQLDIPVNDDSYRYRAIKGEHGLTLYYSLPQHIEIPIGAWCEFQGEVYTLERPENFKKNGTRNFEYTLIMESPQAKLRKYKFRDTSSQKLKFSLTAKPNEHLKMLVDNLNQREQGWQAGECVEAVEKVISYSHNFCLDALSQIAEAFETEYEIVGKTIHLHKVEHNKDNPLPLSYGRGNGFRPGLGRSNYNNSKPVEILFVQGGERNIDTSKYGSPELLLPKNQTLEYEGRTYISDENGFSIRRADKELKSHEEDSLDCSHIYPSRVGTISAVEVMDDEKHFYDFIDDGIPANLDFEACLIEGETMTVIFQSGILTGKEFEVNYKHAERRFEIVPQELDGRTMPDNVFKPAVGDTYAVFGMMMPDAYICDNETESGASWDMFREAAKYLYENEEQKFSFTGELDGIWAKKDWLNIGGRIVLGGYIMFSDTQFQQEGIPIRIIGIKDYINDPYKPTIELSNAPVGSSFSNTLRKIDGNEVVADDLHRAALQFTKRRFRDAQETAKMLQGAMLTNFTNSISPLTVQTMQLLAGDESLQFRFVDRIPEDDADTPQRITHEVTYGTDKVLHSIFHDLTSGVLQHMTAGITDIKNVHAPTEYKYWTLPQFDSPPLAEAEKKYYLYAKCSKGDTTGVFVLSETAIGMEAVAEYYHFLVAMVNSEHDGERSVVTLYGFSEILPGRITTDRIVSSDGKTYFDLINNEVGGRLYFKDGLVSGDIGIGNENGINAGMSGAGNTDTDIRMWAGATKEDKESAPFRITHGGSLQATKGTIGNAKIENGDLVLDGDDSNIIITNRKVTDINVNDVLLKSPVYEQYIINLNSQRTANYAAGPVLKGRIGQTIIDILSVSTGGIYKIFPNIVLQEHYKKEAMALISHGRIYMRLVIRDANGTILYSIAEKVIAALTDSGYGGVTAGQSVETTTNYDIISGVISGSFLFNMPSNSKISLIIEGNNGTYTENGVTYKNSITYDVRALEYYNVSGGALYTLKLFALTNFTATLISKNVYICSDGFYIVSDAYNKIQIRNTGSRASIIMSGLPNRDDAESGEFYVDNGTVKIK